MAADKTITSSTLLEKELEKNEINLSLIHDYASEAQGYLTRVFRFVYALARIEEADREMVSDVSSNKA